VRIGAEGLGGILGKTLFAPLLHDDVWRAFELINAVFHSGKAHNPVRPEAIFVVGPEGQIVVSTVPEELPMLARLDSLGPGYAELARALGAIGLGNTVSVDSSATQRHFFVFPIREESAHVGTLVLAYPKDLYLPRFRGLALYGILVGALVLAVLLPLNWYWGQHMARPLVDLADHTGKALHGGGNDAPMAPYPYGDELGRLIDAYHTLLGELREKAQLEKEILQTERLTAIGRLASGIAHEVNNPLGGMLLALDTLRERGGLPEHAARTMGMLERGLKQIQETVSALLVEARDTGRLLSVHDLGDVHTLIHPQALKKSLDLDWDVTLPDNIPISASACRQILINLLLNAVQATPEGGHIGLTVRPSSGGLWLVVDNDAGDTPPGRLEHLFEPFVSLREGGHGLGLWVTYQIVQQLDGVIAAECKNGEVRFEVWLPMEGT
jgi:signal transduction histidine kinase